MKLTLGQARTIATGVDGPPAAAVSVRRVYRKRNSATSMLDVEIGGRRLRLDRYGRPA